MVEENSNITLKLARGLAAQEGISVQHALQMIQEEFVPSKEIRHEMGKFKENSLDESVSKILNYNSTKDNAMSLESKVTSLNDRHLELEEKRIKLEEERIRREEKREAAKEDERREERRMERDQLREDRRMERDQLRENSRIELERMHQERESARSERQSNFMMVLTTSGNKPSDELLEIMNKGQDSKSDLKDFYKTMLDSKDDQRKYENSFRTELTKIEAERDIELAKLKQQSDTTTVNAIDQVVSTMNANFEHLLTQMPKGEVGDSVTAMKSFKDQLEEHTSFQETLSNAGLSALKAQGVDVAAVQKAHGIESKKESSTIDTLVDTGKVLWDELIKPKIAESKNMPGTGVPSGLESSFDVPSADVETRIRAEQQAEQFAQEEKIASKELDNMKKERVQLDNDYADMIQIAGQKAQQYGIPTHGKTIDEVSQSVSDYEAMMHKQPSEVDRSNSFYEYIGNLCALAEHYSIDISGMSVIQIEKKISDAENEIESSLNRIPEPEPVVESPEPELVVKSPEPEPVVESPEPEPVVESPEPEPEVKSPEPEPEVKSPEPESVVESLEPVPAVNVLKPKKRRAVKAFTINNEIVEAAHAYAAALKTAKSLGGTINNPVRVDVTGPDGTVYTYDTFAERERDGKVIPTPMARKVTD